MENADRLPPDKEPKKARRADVIAREELNKLTDFSVVKTTLNSFCKSKAKALPWDEVLADMNKGVLEAYLLANVDVLRLCQAGLAIPSLNNTFFNQCLSAVMTMPGSRGFANDKLRVSLDVYNAQRKVHFDCGHELQNQYSHQLCREGERRSQKVHSVLHCRSNGCLGMTVNRDVNASRNMLRLLECKLRRQDRPVAYTRQAVA